MRSGISYRIDGFIECDPGDVKSVTAAAKTVEDLKTAAAKAGECEVSTKFGNRRDAGDPENGDGGDDKGADGD